MKKYMCGNEKIKIDDIQDSRIWIHSVELGYGRWVSNDELKDMIYGKRSSPILPSSIVQKANQGGKDE